MTGTPSAAGTSSAAGTPGPSSPPVRVLYLAGSGRSGSTLITTVLGQLDGCFAAGELRYLWQRGMVDNRPCGCGAPFDACPVWRAVTAELAAVAGPASATGPDAAGIARRLRARLRMRDLPAMLRRAGAGRRAVPHHADDAAIAAVYPAVARQVSRGGDGPVVVVDSSKLPPYGALLRDLPGIDLRVLHLVRDPRGTAFSWRRRRGLDGAADRNLMSRPPVWKAALLWRVWNAATARFFEAAGPDRYLRVRYEDVVVDPAGQLRRIALFAGLDPAGLPIDAEGRLTLAATHSVAGNPARHRTGAVPVSDDAEWVRALPGRSFAVVTAVTLPLLRRFGYPVRRPAAPPARAVPPVGAQGGPVGEPVPATTPSKEG
ncbi:MULTISPECIES: sulfotransferase [unclassified Solwaraspora]|uniref:sulfotransferase family protein n=1 Tax=unclassified Solwaraspora TaxID=2627926 RepID=UPI00248BAA45|nr:MULTISPECIES: sulfotransferase [unclassified Solwaraspora]WBB95325.1 sulfotransferase [Solwaraspora sp. WMMA2059]WBC20769.1 sulfotransferase [Solwaraspora sp. WMMA2080]WJK37098.1 sulfotransferase [Solwaraspora sp. WMMA2065]